MERHYGTLGSPSRVPPSPQVYGHVHDYERYWPVHNHSVLLDHSVPGGGVGTAQPSASIDSPTAAGAPTAGSSTAPGRDPNPTVYLNPRATIHVTSGAGGNSEMRAAGAPPPEVLGAAQGHSLPRCSCHGLPAGPVPGI